MEISVSPKTKRLIDEASKKLNLNDEAVINVALESYIKLSEDIELKQELKMWERASDEALENFEKGFGF